MNWSTPESAGRLHAMDVLVLSVFWAIPIGGWSLRFRFTPGQLAVLLLNLHGLVGLAGLSLAIFTDDPWSDVGLALLVGVVFGLTSFGVAWWDKSIDIQIARTIRSETPDQAAEMAELQRTYDRLTQELRWRTREE